MKKLEIKFDDKKKVDVDATGLFTAVEKMPALEYLRVDGLTEEWSVELTCKVITSEVLLGKDIIIRIGRGDEAMMVCGNSES